MSVNIEDKLPIAFCGFRDGAFSISAENVFCSLNPKFPFVVYIFNFTLEAVTQVA